MSVSVRVCACARETAREMRGRLLRAGAVDCVCEGSGKGCREHLSVSFTLKAWRDGKNRWEDK